MRAICQHSHPRTLTLLPYHHVRGQHAADEAEEMALPGDTLLHRQHAPQHTAIEKEREDRQGYGRDAAFVIAACQKIAEKAKDDATDAQVQRVGAAEEPDPQPADQGGGQGDGQQIGGAPHHDQPSQDDKGNRVGQQVPKPGVQPRRNDDGGQTAERARLDAQSIQRTAQEQRVDALDAPQDRDDGAQHNCLL